MRVARLVIGIITIILSIVVLIIGITAAMVAVAPERYGVTNELKGGAWQILLFAFFLAGGIVMVACHKKGELGGCIACTVIFAIALIIGVAGGQGNILSVVVLIPLLIFSIIGIPLAVSRKRREQAQPVYYYTN